MANRRRRTTRRYTLASTRWDLHYGHFGTDDEGRSIWAVDETKINPPIFANDEEAEAAFSSLEPSLTEDDWAYWRFVRELEPEQAIAAVWARRKREHAESNRRCAAKQSMPDWWYVQRMLEKADELECEAEELERVAAT